MTTVKRIIIFAWKHLWRNAWLSFITITVMTISVMAINIIITADYLKRSAINYYGDKLVISVALRQNIEPAEVDRLVGDLKAQSTISSVGVLTPEENKEKVSKAFPKIKDVFSVLPTNPLSYRINIQPKEIGDSETIINYLQADGRKELLGQTPELEDNRTAAVDFEKKTNLFNLVTSIIALLFLIFALLIVYNTVRISLYTQRDEVGIMKLVGATNWFIRAPFFIESFVSTVVSVLLAGLLFYATLQILTPFMAEWIGEPTANLLNYFRNNMLLIGMMEFLGILLVQMVCVLLALRRYLRV